MLLLILPTAVLAQFNYSTLAINGKVTITGCTGPGGAIKIPSVIDGLPVTSIGPAAFFGCTGLTSVTIPNSVTNIAGGFSDCTRLTGITVDALNPTYASADGVLFNKRKTSLLEFPPGKAGSYTIPDSVTNVDSAFTRCTGLTNVTIPNSVTSIRVPAFLDCTRLTGITVDALNPAYTSADGVLFNKLKTEIIVCPDGKTGSYTIPDSVTNIAPWAFSDCTGLSSVTIPDSVISIKEDAFFGCTSLSSVTIPKNVTSIGSAAFLKCSSLTGITVDALNPTYASADGVLFNKRKTSLLEFPPGKAGSYTIPDSVTSIAYLAFSHCTGLTDVTIPNSVTSIGPAAFFGCTGLTSATIPNSVTNIGDYAFSGCTNLTTATAIKRK